MMKWDEWSSGRRQMARAMNTVTHLAVVIVPPLVIAAAFCADHAHSSSFRSILNWLRVVVA
jgi:hypothetical protein